jgi:hypothetical protein
VNLAAGINGAVITIGRIACVILSAGACLVAGAASASPFAGAAAPLLQEAIRPADRAQTSRSRVKAYSIFPASGPAGVEAAVTGFGFTDDNAIHFGDRIIARVAVKSAIAIACTTNPGCRGGIHQTLAFTIPDAPAGVYRVWVENSNGNSNSLRFSLTKR